MRRILLTVNHVIDKETGPSVPGEVGHGIYIGNLEPYLDQYGRAGKDRIISSLGYLIYEIERRFQEQRELPPGGVKSGETGS